MNGEYHSLLANDTWDLVPLPKGRKLVRCKWVYRTKYGPDGKVDKHKARLAAKGFSQVEGIDYTETFSPIAKMNSIRLVLSLAASLKWEVHQMDVKYAFLQGDLHEEIYMEQPIGFIQTDSSLVCRLKKSLYGLKQAPRAWKTLVLTHTRPDLSFVVGLVARFMKNPRESHWKVAKRILRYVRGIVQFGIHYSAKAAPLLVGFTDSDWAVDPDDRKSTAGYVFTLGSGPITWACKKQAAISLSSAEAEYRGAVEASKEALWLRQILSEFGFEQQHRTTLWCDNQSAIQLCKDPVQHQRSKHIELHMHFIRKLIHDHVLEVQYCSTDDQVADIFPKALTEAKFTKLRYMLRVQEVVTKGG
eukprot:PITA_25371